MRVVENFSVVRGFEAYIIRIIANSSRPLMKSPLFPYIWFFMDMSYFTCMDFSPALSMTFLKALESLASWIEISPQAPWPMHPSPADLRDTELAMLSNLHNVDLH